MTLIPLISALWATPQATTAPAGASVLQPRNSYGSDTNRHPVAALFAVGLPAALVVAVALSPMIIKPEPHTKSKSWTSVSLPKPKPPEPEVKPDAQPQPSPPITAPMPRVDLPPLVPVDLNPAPPIETPITMTGGTGTATTRPVERPAPPPLVLAKLDPRYADMFQPEYPPNKQREGIEGVTVVRVLIGTDGRVKAVELVSTDDSAFFEATKRRALTKWRFKAATRGGVAEESWKEMRVRFEIKNA
jgi:protein TonB